MRVGGDGLVKCGSYCLLCYSLLISQVWLKSPRKSAMPISREIPNILGRQKLARGDIELPNNASTIWVIEARRNLNIEIGKNW